MRRIRRPAIDDAAALTNLVTNNATTLTPALPSLLEAYTQYENSDGNAFRILGVLLNKDEKDILHYYYGHPTTAINYINPLRNDDEDMCCPMCGSMFSGTLDHVLPKEHYAAFSVFSGNLVPACKCNIRRGVVTTGSAPSQRVLHPYYDDCMEERLMMAKFENLGISPEISLILTIDATHPSYEEISFHVRTVITKMPILQFLRRRWKKLCSRPTSVFGFLRRPIMSEADLKQKIEESLIDADDLHESKNNWTSVFISGVLDDAVISWIYNQLSRPGRQATDPLILP